MKCGHCEETIRRADPASPCPMNGQPGHESHLVCAPCLSRMTADADQEQAPVVKALTPKEVVRNHAGARVSRRCRVTKTVVTLYEGKAADMDTAGGSQPWSTMCEDHGTIISHDTYRLALQNLSHPDEWCEECGHTTKAHLAMQKDNGP